MERTRGSWGVDRCHPTPLELRITLELHLMFSSTSLFQMRTAPSS